MIKITFPDGSVREYNEGVTGLQIAESISSRLAQDVLACGVNGETMDLSRPINEDASIVLYKWDDAEGKHAFWHTASHILAQAVKRLYPEVKLICSLGNLYWCKGMYEVMQNAFAEKYDL